MADTHHTEPTARERLYAEELPTGTFGGARTHRTTTATKTRHTTTPTAQATHLRELADAIGAQHHTPTADTARRSPTVEEPAA